MLVWIQCSFMSMEESEKRSVNLKCSKNNDLALLKCGTPTRQVQKTVSWRMRCGHWRYTHLANWVFHYLGGVRLCIVNLWCSLYLKKLLTLILHFSFPWIKHRKVSTKFHQNSSLYYRLVLTLYCCSIHYLCCSSILLWHKQHGSWWWGRKQLNALSWSRWDAVLGGQMLESEGPARCWRTDDAKRSNSWIEIYVSSVEMFIRHCAVTQYTTAYCSVQVVT